LALTDSFLITPSGFQYQWCRNDTLIANSNFNIFSLNKSGNYKVAITNSFGCTAFSETFLYELPNGIKIKNTPAFQIKPNPSQGLFQFISTNEASFIIYIADLQGK